MIDTLFNFINDIGIIGLFIAMFFKGSTFPLPSLIFIVSYGYLLNPSLHEMIGLALAMSLTFTLSSYIPYTIGSKLEDKIQKRFGSRLAKAQLLFKKYGEWSVFFTRPFTIGMYISYVAGIGKVKYLKYSILTFFGILPWSFFILYISKLFKGNINEITQLMRTYTIPAGIIFVILIGLYAVFLLNRRSRMKHNEI